MLKEFSIIGVILIIIIGGNILMQQYLKNSSEPIIQDLEQLYEQLVSNQSEKEELKQKVEEIDKQWEGVSKIWTMIILHSELDQIEIAMINTRTAIDVDEFEEASLELKKAIFLLEHIQEKDAFKIKNIF